MSIGYQEINTAVMGSSCVLPTDEFKTLIEKFRPEIVLEVGTYKGLSTAVLASIAEKVYTFDIKHQAIAKEIWKLLLINEKIEYNIIKDISEIKDNFKNIKFDFAFVDITHQDYELLKRAFDMLFQMGIKRILFDGVIERFPASIKLATEKNMKVLYGRYGYWEGYDEIKL